MGIPLGQVAIVTGGTSGIGKYIAEVIVEQGATVIAAGRRDTRQCVGLTFIRSDVSRDEDVSALFEEVLGRFG